MSDPAEFKSSVNELIKINDSISSEFSFNNSSAIGEKIEKAAVVLNRTNNMVSEFYKIFPQAQEEIDRIVLIMEEDPEGADRGTAYIKRR